MFWLCLLMMAAESTPGASASKIVWSGNYGDSLAATKKNDKPLLITLDKPQVAAERMEPDQLAADGFAGDLLANYELCHIDVTTDYGKRVAEAFKVEQFPYTVLINRDGSRILRRIPGKFNDNQWRQTLTTYKNGTRPVVRRVRYRRVYCRT